MGKNKQKLTTTQKAERKRRRQEYMTIIIHGKQKRIRRPPTVEGIDVDEFILQNADPVWLHQNEMWEYMEMKVPYESCKVVSVPTKIHKDPKISEAPPTAKVDDDIPF